MIPRKLAYAALSLICAAMVISSEPSRRRPNWFYTGKLVRDSITERVFAGSDVNLWRLPNDFSPTLLYGGILANFSSFNVTLMDSVQTYVHRFLNPAEPSDFRVAVARHYNLVGTIDYKQPLGLQTGLYDFDMDEMIEFSEVPARYGVLSLLIVEERSPIVSIPRAESTTSTSLDGGSGDRSRAEPDAPCLRVHALALSVDQRGRPSPLQYTVLAASGSDDQEAHTGDTSIEARNSYCKALSERLLQRLEARAEPKGPDAASTEEASAREGKAATSLRVMTYNMWHTNPAAWAVQFFGARWERYWRRINFLVDVILDEDPDVLFLQEVRWDGGFDPYTARTPMQDYFAKYTGAADGDAELDCMRGGSQLTHVVCMLELKSAIRRRSAPNTEISSTNEGACEASSIGSDVCANIGDNDGSSVGIRRSERIYEFAFQPAMSMSEKDRMWVRGEEEGVAIIVKRRPIASSKSTTSNRKCGEVACLSNSPQAQITLNLASIDHVLLPRTLDDKTDDHQRVLLHVSVDMHILAGNDHHESNGQPLASKTKLHLYSTHLSLNERARNDSYIAISLKMEKDGGFLQVLGGDLNAEPHESGVRELLLVEESAYERTYSSARDRAIDGGEHHVGAGTGVCSIASGAVVSAGESVQVEALSDGDVQAPSPTSVASGAAAPRGFLRDMWRQSRVHGWHSLSDSQRIAMELDRDQGPDGRDDLGLTFPTCDPKKRIDYLLYREPELPCSIRNGISCSRACAVSDHRVQSIEVYAIGADATPDTAHLYREGVGMLDRDSPLWASDHLGLVANIEIAV